MERAYLFEKLGERFVIRHNHRAVIILEASMNDGAPPALPQAAHPRLVVRVLPILILFGALKFTGIRLKRYI